MSSSYYVIVACLEAINSKDINAFTSNFAKDAVVIDEGRHYSGVNEFKAWSAKALIAHNASVIDHETIRHNFSAIVHVTMDGDFQTDYGIAETFSLYFAFAMSSNNIASLTNTPWNPATTKAMTTLLATKAYPISPLSSLLIASRPQPTPPNGWQKVKIAAAGLNYHDIFTMGGHGQHELKVPRILGCEGTGTFDPGWEAPRGKETRR
jgi:hypothetical protein